MPESFSPKGKTLILSGKTTQLGICKFTGVKAPFIAYVVAPGHRPTWRYVSSTTRALTIQLGGGAGMPSDGVAGGMMPPGGVAPPNQHQPDPSSWVGAGGASTAPNQNQRFRTSDWAGGGGSSKAPLDGKWVALVDPASPTNTFTPSLGILKPASRSELSGLPAHVRGGKLGNVTRYIYHKDAKLSKEIETQKTYLFAVPGDRLRTFEGLHVDVRGKPISLNINGRRITFLYPHHIRVGR